MAAITVAWTEFASTALDPDSPVDTTLITGLFNDAKYVREWLGAGYYAGAAQNHSHNGVDSALVEIGPNALRNGSFESDTAGWTLTNYTGGSNAISTSVRQHGAKSLSFTSTVLANGGGDALSNEFRPVAGGKYYPVEVWISASVANVSAKAQVSWYDAAQSFISSSDIANLTNTPTTATNYGLSIQAPSTARYAKIKLIGGVPSVGSATGTIYFDGIVFGDIPNLSIVEPMLAASAVSQSKLKTTTASGSTTAKSYSLTGGTYSWWTASALNDTPWNGWGNGDTSAGVIGTECPGGVNNIFYVDERYVQASPPYRKGPLFAYVAIRPDGTFAAIQVAPDPIWAYHGPTDITPEFIRDGKAYRTVRLVDGVPMALAIKDPATLRRLMAGEAVVTLLEREITLAYKDSDMAVVPHPFGNISGVTIALLEPGTTMMQRFADFCDAGAAREVRQIIESGRLIIDSTPLAVADMPPGVAALRARWKLTA